MNRVSKLGLAAMCSVAAISVVIAQGGPPPSPQQRADNAVKVRQSLFEVQNFAFQQSIAMLRGAAPFNAQTAETTAKRVEMTTSMIPDVFKFDTRMYKVNTKARDDIWANMADFQQKAQAANMAAQNLEMVAMSGDAGMTKAAIGALGKACGNCHDQFKNK
jgi:cytochrome c556